MNSKANCLFVPPGLPFAPALARWVMQKHGRGLMDCLILLPNRRACRSLREAFLAESGGEPMLLPRIQPIGEMGEADAASFADIPALLDIPPAISPVRRHLLLTQEVMKAHRFSVDQSAALARQLAGLLDDVAREGISLEGLSVLAPEELSQHWQQTLDFLKILSHRWPEMLEGEGVIDPVDRRTRVLKAVAKHWVQQPPAYPVIAAGSTGSQPATAALLAAIARLPQGAVILPGLDTRMEDAEWKMLGETHPQFGLKQLLEIIGCARSHVAALAETPAANNLLATILQPPTMTAQWAKKPPHAAMPGALRVLVADTQHDEARMIAVALRESLETPGKTAALVTPDRTLARMVAAQMQRFGIAIDDSAGQRLLDTPVGSLMRLAIEVAASRAAPAPLLALLRHPLAAVGFSTAECRRLSRQLETSLLRGVRHMPGLEALAHATHDAKLKPLLATLAEYAVPLAQLFNQGNAGLRPLLEAHIRFCEIIAASDEQRGEERLWSGDDGNAMAEALSALLEQADVLPAFDVNLYGELFETLLAEAVVRPSFGSHPRLAILSPIEARLQPFDLAILGGMNEGTWPALPPADPWMSRPMRKQFGLPAAERAIGQAAHDMFILASSPEVILTRARKVEGAPSVPSRWLVRLETWMKNKDPEGWQSMLAADGYAAALALLDTPADMPPLAPPAPTPPLAARPQKLYVTAIDKLLRDPYMIYAKHILSLTPLAPLDQDPDALDYGKRVHSAFEQYLRRGEGGMDALLECGRVAFAELMDLPAMACLWWPRFEVMAAWFLAQQEERRASIMASLCEINGAWRMMIDDAAFTLSTRIDRIDLGHDGGLTIIDYKTGGVPTANEIKNGEANQMALEALIIKYGELSAEIANCGQEAVMEYWKLSGNEAQCEVIAVSADVEAARQRLENVIRMYRNPAQAYEPAAYEDKNRRNDYAHLTRRQEWETA